MNRIGGKAFVCALCDVTDAESYMTIDRRRALCQACFERAFAIAAEANEYAATHPDDVAPWAPGKRIEHTTWLDVALAMANQRPK